MTRDPDRQDVAMLSHVFRTAFRLRVFPFASRFAVARFGRLAGYTWPSTYPGKPGGRYSSVSKPVHSGPTIAELNWKLRRSADRSSAKLTAWRSFTLFLNSGRDVFM